MDGRCVLLTGFGAFEEVSENPSGWLARELDGAHLGGGRLVGAVLPVSFQRAPQELEALVERVQPDAIVATGVHGGEGFRVERGAGVELAAGRPDMDGVDAGSLPAREGARLESGLDVDRLAAAIAASGAGDVQVSPDAGRYVCECTYRRALELGADRGPHGVFVHVPSQAHVPLARQRTALEALLTELLAQLE